MQNYTDSPYKKIPADLASKYTMDNQIPIFDWWLDGRINDNIIWNPVLIRIIQVTKS